MEQSNDVNAAFAAQKREIEAQKTRADKYQSIATTIESVLPEGFKTIEEYAQYVDSLETGKKPEQPDIKKFIHDELSGFKEELKKEAEKAKKETTLKLQQDNFIRDNVLTAIKEFDDVKDWNALPQELRDDFIKDMVNGEVNLKKSDDLSKRYKAYKYDIERAKKDKDDDKETKDKETAHASKAQGGGEANSGNYDNIPPDMMKMFKKMGVTDEK